MSAESGTKRLFIAVMLPSEVRERVAALVDLLEGQRAILRPARPDGLHLTLRFLGDATPDEERRASEACAAAVAGVGAFPLVVAGFGVFPNGRRPRVVWLGVRGGTAPLTALQWRVEDELLRRGVIASRDDFTPHLTLARVRGDASPSTRAALGAAVGRGAGAPDRDGHKPCAERAHAARLHLYGATHSPTGAARTGSIFMNTRCTTETRRHRDCVGQQGARSGGRPGTLTPFPLSPCLRVSVVNTPV